MLAVNDTSDAQLEVLPEYNPYMPARLVASGAFFGEHFRRPVYSVRRSDGVFDTLFALTNRPRYMGDGTLVRGKGINVGRLRYGTLASNTINDWWWDAAAGVMEIRLSWGLINVSDPSTGKNFGWMVSGSPRWSRQRASSARRYACRCGARLPSGSPPDTGKMTP